MNSSIKNKSIIITIVFCTFSLTGCLFMGVSKWFSKNDLKYLNWIKPGLEMNFVSSENDTVKYVFLEYTHRYFECHNWPSSCGSDTYSRIYRYKKIESDTSYVFEFGKVEKSRKSTTTNILFEGTFHLIYESSEPEFSSMNYKGVTVKDVYEEEVVHHNNLRFNSETGQRKIWMSLSKGLLKYETRDGKTWTRY